MHNTPLHTAAFQGYAGIVGLLLDAGADVNANGTAGNMPLHLASPRSSGETMEVLLGAGADPPSSVQLATCSNRNTPLRPRCVATFRTAHRGRFVEGPLPEEADASRPCDDFQAQRPLARVLQAVDVVGRRRRTG